ncbi:MAG: CotH kinase family protein [Bacteroidales bacterium]|nr:CotH kinase family protein [Bacteroidales bacterium]
MKKLLILIIILTGFSINILHSQPSFPANGKVFIDDIVPRVDIFINPDTLEWIYENVESDIEFHADFIFNNGEDIDTIEDIGFRLRGNTSRHSQKKSFKVSFNTFVQGRKYCGLEKINLNGEHNDPSITRSKICWDVLREFEIPASRSNHVELYINNNYYGLYLNVEHVDEEFVESRFGNKDGNLYKCLWPADLNYLGDDPELYKFDDFGRRTYDLKTNTAEDNYSDFANFIDILNNTPDNEFACEIRKVFNIDDYLKIIAIDIISGNWDGYIYNKNNFYLYHNTETDKFEYILYDLDNTLGIDWIGRDWGDRNIYDWQQHGNEVRPLYTRIMDIPEFKDQYSYYVNILLNEITKTEIIFPKIETIKSMISPYVVNDPYYPLDYGYSYQDFLNSFEETLGGHAAYGIKPYFEIRNNSASQQLELNNIIPIVKYMQYNTPQINVNLDVTLYVKDENSNPNVEIIYVKNGGSSNSIEMFDDGMHNDGEAGDNFYGNSIPALTSSGTMDFQIKVSDNNFNFVFSPCEMIQLEISPSADPLLYINEFMASNDTTISDEFGEFEDWIEIYNGDSESIWLGDKYLSDNFDNPDKWQLPQIDLPSNEFLLIWADNDTEQGENHTNFKLKQEGEQIGIFDSDTTGFFPLDTLTFGLQQTDISFGRKPDGGNLWMFFDTATPGYSNVSSGIYQYSLEQFRIFPNPVSGDFLFFNEKRNEIKLSDLSGKTILIAKKTDVLNISSLSKGFYIISTNRGETSKIVVR